MRREIRFLLGAEERRLSGFDPLATVLNWLRREERLAGTKEGCAEGDCGACTVVLGEPGPDGGLRYRPVNACILFLPALDGKQLLTVEHLKAADGALHPVQRAMAERHASQCGFCTPGFAMSLFALQADGGPGRPPADRQAIDDALAGNLCRCTGYGPIVAAARAMGPPPAGAAVADGPLDRAATAARLAALDAGGPLAVEGAGTRWFAPTEAGALCGLLAGHPGAVLLAGATDAGLWVTKQHRRLETIIYLGAIPELRRIREAGGALEIGAAATYEDALAALDGRAPDLAETIRRIGSRQIRGAGTVVGNIANGSPIGDSPPPLIALGATLALRSAAGRREIPLEAFFLDYGRQDLRPGEFVESVRVPLARAAGLRCYKVSKRFDQDITAVLGAFDIEVADGTVRSARVCFGGMAAIPKRAAACEAALAGRRWDRAAVEAGRRALERDFAPISDHRASAGYRLAVARNLLDKAFLETTAPDIPTRLAGPGSHGHG